MNQESYLAKKYLLNQVTQRVKEGIERTDVRGAGTTLAGAGTRYLGPPPLHAGH